MKEIWLEFRIEQRGSDRSSIQCSKQRLSSLEACLRLRHFFEHQASFFTLCQRSNVEDTNCQLLVIAVMNVTYKQRTENHSSMISQNRCRV